MTENRKTSRRAVLKGTVAGAIGVTGLTGTAAATRNDGKGTCSNPDGTQLIAKYEATDTDDDGKNELVFEKTDTGLDPASNFSFAITPDEDDEIKSLAWDSYPYTITDIVVKAGPDCEHMSVDQKMHGSVTPSNGKAIGNIRFCATAPVIRPLYQANAGGGFTASNGDQWDPLTDYLVAGGDQTASFGQSLSGIDSSVPSGTPSQIWETERWDPDDGNEMQYEFPVPEGEQAEVRLYFYDGYGGTSSVGDRVFDISVEDQTVENFDIIEAYGDQTGAMKSFTVTSDGTIDVDFAHVFENPQINAIEILPLES
ncbi:malectin domain-containing carbohydrate-binding protein [Haloarcula sp. JP-L23]|uniref:malectin domain-containing carbohydrate-binding protein n=1 Tax=Haloarcula sp. JP-L23 TaxID=2716717 RepID=UPI00140F4609|nr:hypothetical protein G9465_10785 [Haloarcula sp. JP-L23]